MAFKVKITGPGPIKRDYADIIQRRSKECVLRMAVELKKRMVKRSLRLADSGQMADSWQINPANPQIKGKDVTSRVATTGPGGIVALVWDRGTRPGRHPFPPTRRGSPLRRWVRRRLSVQDDDEAGRVAFRIARSIKRRGLPNPANPGTRRKGVFTRTFKRSRRRLTEISQVCQRLIAADIARNR